MASFHLWTRAQSRYVRTASRAFCRRPFAIKTQVPVISFSFDDFPRSALHTGGAILQRFGLAGTYYTSLGLMGKQSPTGTMFLREDLDVLFEQGHELGCHTFNHCHAWETRPDAFEDSVMENQVALQKLIPEASFKTFSYPMSPPRPRTKQKIGRHFLCCRGGSQTFNSGMADLNYLLAYFLEKSRDNLEAVKNVIEQNRQARGWLIFATHDVGESPTPYGCTPGFFEAVVRCAMDSGARILPVGRACEALGASSS